MKNKYLVIGVIVFFLFQNFITLTLHAYNEDIDNDKPNNAGWLESLAKSSGLPDSTGGSTGIIIENFTEQIVILRHVSRVTPFKFYLSFAKDTNRDPYEVIEYYENQPPEKMENRIILLYIQETNWVHIITDANSETLTQLNIDSIKKTMQEEYSSNEEWMEHTVGVLVREIYELGNYDTTDKIDDVLNKFAIPQNNNNNLYFILPITFFVVCFILYRKGGSKV